MKKRLGDCLAILVMALLVLLLADWYFSYHRSDVILINGPGARPIVITTGRGLVYVAAANVPIQNRLPWSLDLRFETPEEVEDRFEQAAEFSNFHMGYRIVPAATGTMAAAAGWTTTERNAWGFALITGKTMSGVPGTFYLLASAPFWAIIPPLALISFLWSKHNLQQRSWRLQGRCRHCGYDLRASPDRCPECGMTPA